jgi:hypothetical protein
MSAQLLDLGYSFKRCTRDDYDERLRMVRVVHRKPLSMREIHRGGSRLGTVYLVGDDPVAFYGADGTYFVRAT